MRLRSLAVLCLGIVLIGGCSKAPEPANDQAVSRQDDKASQDSQQGQDYNSENKTSNQAETKAEPLDPMKLRFEEAFADLRFDTPVGVKHAGDGSGQLYVVEQAGRIQLISAAQPVKRLFLDLTDIVSSKGWEQGLLGLAFHPEYEHNGRFYVNYTTSNSTIIAEYTRSEVDPEQADRSSGRVLLTFKQPYDNHNGGELAFGPDGYLYIAVGDGGSGGDPDGHGQNRKTLLGSILRIDVDDKTDQLAYGIPQDNPFVHNQEGYREEIYAYGLRNPWRMSFDTQTGRLWAADVGQNRTEEINIIHKGHNYGWNVMEGPACYRQDNCETEGLTLPVWSYGATERGASITGGYVYRGSAIPPLSGMYIFSDFMDGRIWALAGEDAESAVVYELDQNLTGITSFGVDENGEIYACLYDGTIYMLQYKEGE